jgi:hypothetical protein
MDLHDGKSGSQVIEERRNTQIKMSAYLRTNVEFKIAAENPDTNNRDDKTNSKERGVQPRIASLLTPGPVGVVKAHGHLTTQTTGKKGPKTIRLFQPRWHLFILA